MSDETAPEHSRGYDELLEDVQHALSHMAAVRQIDGHESTADVIAEAFTTDEIVALQSQLLELQNILVLAADRGKDPVH